MIRNPACVGFRIHIIVLQKSLRLHHITLSHGNLNTVEWSPSFIPHICDAICLNEPLITAFSVLAVDISLPCTRLSYLKCDLLFISLINCIEAKIWEGEAGMCLRNSPACSAQRWHARQGQPARYWMDPCDKRVEHTVKWQWRMRSEDNAGARRTSQTHTDWHCLAFSVAKRCYHKGKLISE